MPMNHCVKHSRVMLVQVLDCRVAYAARKDEDGQKFMGSQINQTENSLET